MSKPIVVLSYNQSFVTSINDNAVFAFPASENAIHFLREGH